MNKKKEILAYNPMKILTKLKDDNPSISENKKFWWISNIVSFYEIWRRTTSECHQQSFSWQFIGFQWEYLNDISMQILIRILKDVEYSYLAAHQLMLQANPQWERELDETINNSFQQEHELVNNSLMSWLVVLIKSNKMDKSLFKGHEQAFNQFIHDKKVDPYFLDLWINKLKFDYTISTLQGHLWEIFKRINSKTLLQKIWIDFKTYYDVILTYGFRTSPNNTTNLKLKEIFKQTTTKYQDLIHSTEKWKEELMRLADKDNEWELSEAEGQQAEVLYIVLITKYLNKLDKSIDFIIRFR